MNSSAVLPPTGTVRSWLDRRAAEQGADVSHYFIDEDPLTWADLQVGALETAGRLAGMGLSKGDSVALMLPNSRQGILCLFGLLYGGFRAVVINLVPPGQYTLLLQALTQGRSNPDGPPLAMKPVSFTLTLKKDVPVGSNFWLTLLLLLLYPGLQLINYFQFEKLRQES